MGVETYLVSDKTKTYFDLGKVFWDEDVLDDIKAAATLAEKQDVIIDAFFDDINELNIDDAQAGTLSGNVLEWMVEHPDWRFMSDQHAEHDDVYLAIDAEDAKEYKEEFGDDCSPIYFKSGSLWGEGADDDDED
jgi:hypothetical protein